MHAQLDELLGARDKMEQLLRVIVGLASDLDLDATLHRIVTAAMELTGAGYGALGVLGPDGMLVSFLNSGMDSETVDRIGHLPVGKGVLGVLLDEPQPLRVDDLNAHAAAVGFPEHHPPMRAFLGVPITIRQNMFGSLYLTEPKSRATFTEADEAMVRALASAAAVAIDNAQMFDRARTTAKWMEASRAITTALLSDTDPVITPLRMIAERACELTNAEQAIVLVPSDADLAAEDVDTLVVSTAVGLLADEVVGRRVPVDGSTTGGVFRSGVPLITESFRHPIEAFTDVGQRPAIVMPLRAHQSVLGILAVARNNSQPPFDTSHLELMGDFADHAVVALRLSENREQARELSLVTDRERIAHDLHDHVIQRLFAAGMDLQGTIARSRSPEVTKRLNRTVDELQTTIEEIRSRIFALQSVGEEAGFRQSIQNAIAALTDDREVETTVRISGPLSAVSDELAEQATPVVIEAVSNALRHSGAQHLTIEIDVAEELIIDVTDDGCGIDDDDTRRSGLANMLRRAELVGGSCAFGPATGGGTHVHWVAPLDGY
ncbi:GAF domain-containing protein [Mycolicibacterium sp. P9-64]|uniref:sensor histidine kinase n=1 Tax=Mycolicibacterium sp. P9-64 TaxID=2024612 RepID=UPI0011EE8D1F|nr:GAF domain-containing protein [Mycolicibacterium sp. P9-64]KAA0079518.1 GAF domain-containing protein [Mycolicibacterium sp. P9-64]